MKITLIILCVFHLFLTQTLFSQIRTETLSNGVFNNNLETFALQKVKKIYNTEYSKHITGTYYLFDEWKKCNIINNQEKSFKTICNYNLFDDQFELKYEADIYSITTKNIKTILVNKDQYLPFENQRILSNNKGNYYKLLAKGKNVDLIETYELEVRQISSTNNLGIYENKIIIKKNLFFIINDKYILVPKRKRKIFEILKLDPEQVKKYKNKNFRIVENIVLLIKNM